MRISDALRQEPMPEMVYALCKMAGTDGSKKNEILRLITLDSQEKPSNDQFNAVFKFSIDCNFIEETGSGSVRTNFTKEELSTFRKFRYAIFREVFKDNTTKFTQLAKWYMSQEITENPSKKTSILGMTTSSDFLRMKPTEIVVDDNFFNGFRFWMTALGLTSFYAPAVGTRPIMFAANRALSDWLEFSKPFPATSNIPARVFFEKLIADCPVFVNCIKGNDISFSLSMALRIMNNCEIIDLKRVTDAGDVWHLSKSVNYSSTNDITDIGIKVVNHA